MTASPDCLPLAAYVCTDEGATLARHVIDASGGSEAALRGGGLSGAARVTDGAPLARILLAELGSLPLPAACDSVAELCRSGAEVIVLGQPGDLTTYRALREAGARDYFAFPVRPEDILSLTATAPANFPGTAPRRATRLAVTGCGGGVGASVLARALAVHASGPATRTALIDADLRFGAQATELDCDETPGLTDALSAPDRVDATFLASTMTALDAHLSLYSHQPGDSWDIPRLTAGLAPLMPVLGREFDAVVLDLPRAVALDHPELLQALDALVLVVPPGYAGVRAACRLIRRFQELAPALAVHPVLTDLRRDANLRRADIEAALERPILATLPRADAAVERAQRAASATVAGPYAREVATLWRGLTRAEAAPVARPMLKRLFG